MRLEDTVTPNIINTATIEETIRTDEITLPTTTEIVGTMTIMTAEVGTNPASGKTARISARK